MLWTYMALSVNTDGGGAHSRCRRCRTGSSRSTRSRTLVCPQSLRMVHNPSFRSNALRAAYDHTMHINVNIDPQRYGPRRIARGLTLTGVERRLVDDRACNAASLTGAMQG